MKTIKEWAEYYKCKGIWVFPFNQSSFSWNDWRGKSQETYQKEFDSYNWKDAEKLLMVAGGTKRKAVFVINNLKDKNINYVYRLLKAALSELGLPSGYPWVVWDKSILGIIVDIFPDVQGKAFEIHAKRVSIIWEKSFTVPSPNSKIDFWSGRRPETRPEQVDSGRLIEVAKSFHEKYIEAKVHKKENMAEVSDKINKGGESYFEKTSYWYLNKLLGLVGLIGIICYLFSYYYGMTDIFNMATVGYFIGLILIVVFVVMGIIKMVRGIINKKNGHI